MATTFISTATQVLVNLTAGNTLLVTNSGSVSAIDTQNAAITAQFGSNNISIAGLVYGEGLAMLLNYDELSPGNTVTTITQTGSVISDGDAILTSGLKGFIDNFGLISAANVAIYALTSGADSSDNLTNAGTVSGLSAIVVAFNGAGFSDFSVMNTGTIMGRDYAFLSEEDDGQDTITNFGLMIGRIDTGGFADTIRNAGTMDGVVSMGEGTDEFNNVAGDSVTVDLGADDDRMLFGSAAELAIGGAGIDTADYTFAGKFMLDLEDAAENTGGANGDVLLEFEVIKGSQDGGDTLLGDATEMRLEGNAGRDLIDGRAGDDTIDGGTGRDNLIGGVGSDQLTGGGGNDKFIYRTLAEAGDGIRDFKNVAGNDDALYVSVDFASGLNGAAIVAAQFKSGTNNAARDADDRFIYDAVRKVLWYDNDGTGAVAAVKVATFGGNTVLKFGDLVFFDTEAWG